MACSKAVALSFENHLLCLQLSFPAVCVCYWEVSKTLS